MTRLLNNNRIINDLFIKKAKRKKNGQIPAIIATPGSVSYSIPPNSQTQPDQESNTNLKTNETTEDFSNIEPDQMKFFEDTDCKKLQDKTTDINKNLVDVERILRELQPIVIKDAPEFIPILVDQSESNIAGTQFMNNYRWITKAIFS